jgi:hypothetical protein
MAHQKLQIEEINSCARFIRLSNGQKYLFMPDYDEVISKWSVATTVWIGEDSYAPKAYELRNSSAMEEFIVAFWVAS